MTVVYINKPLFQLYALFGAGTSFPSLSSNVQINNSYSAGPPTTDYGPATDPHFNFQLDPVCIRVGKKVQAFLELGAGYKGILNGGLIYRIGKPKPTASLEVGHKKQK
jgi:hypothetical protein